jgi:hypothetical protein
VSGAMTAIAFWLLRRYPAAWRMRYEDEMRAMLEDRPPTVFDLAGLAHGAVAERVRALVDPEQHPHWAFVLDGLFGWLGAVFALNLISGLAAFFLERQLGAAPRWVEVAALPAVWLVAVRALVGSSFWSHIPLSITMRPLGRAAVRRWWAVLYVAVTAALWTHRPLLTDTWMMLWAPALLISATEISWNRRRTGSQFYQARREFLAAVRSVSAVQRFARTGAAADSDLIRLVENLNALRQRLADARLAYGAARLWTPPPSRPLDL